MLRKIRIMISKGIAFVYVFILYHLKSKKQVNNKKILIIFGGHLGNALLNADLVERINMRFKKEDGWEIYLYINSKNYSLLKKVINVEGINVLDIEYPFENGGTDFKSVYAASKYFKNRSFDKIVVNLAHIMPLAGYVVGITRNNESIGVFDDISHETTGIANIDHNFGSTRWYFERAYSDPIKVDYNTQEYIRIKKMLVRLGDNSFESRIIPLPKLSDYRPTNNKYITITVDSSTSKKRFEMKKFAAIANYFSSKYGFDVCLSGTGDSIALYNEFVDSINDKERIINCIGSTSFDQWVELLRGALFHIGVDSGSIHVAASVGTQAFCIVGAWDGKRALPYVNDRVDENTVPPICVYMQDVEKLPCYGCLPLSGVMGHNNTTCYERCSTGNNCVCLCQISDQDVIDVVEKWLHDNYELASIIQ